MTLIESSRVSPQTREILLARLAPDDAAYRPLALTSEHLVTLRHVLARVIPQTPGEGTAEIDLAARVDKQLSEAKGDGWRYASLPGDTEACRAGLSLLDELAANLNNVSFAELMPTAQDSLLEGIASGRLLAANFDLMRWFEDLRANAAQIYVSHPQTLARIGYSGISDDPHGFVQIGIGQRETWEPESR